MFTGSSIERIFISFCLKLPGCLHLLRQRSCCICTCTVSSRVFVNGVSRSQYHFSASYQLSKRKVLSRDPEEGDVKTTVMRTLIANQRAPWVAIKVMSAGPGLRCEAEPQLNHFSSGNLRLSVCIRPVRPLFVTSNFHSRDSHRNITAAHRGVATQCKIWWVITALSITACVHLTFTRVGGSSHTTVYSTLLEVGPSWWFPGLPLAALGSQGRVLSSCWGGRPPAGWAAHCLWLSGALAPWQVGLHLVHSSFLFRGVHD